MVFTVPLILSLSKDDSLAKKLYEVTIHVKIIHNSCKMAEDHLR
ncbi:hypothetical protein MGMO_26c00230 [Methyloglobulus morosus KoM1]|uniref:Uncharacterized protein n=1 Tax=Methyloglobulus morosus KoM1 TaxID=1116472 RepID=V5E174_9GAMM|nr:hypothetical protein MGMO_26c00230 [Methyloglobulus morosus KoM1]